MIWLFLPSIPPDGCENTVTVLDVFTGGKEVEWEKSIYRQKTPPNSVLGHKQYIPMAESQIEKIWCYLLFLVLW